MAKIFVSRLLVRRGELIREGLGANAVISCHKVVVGDGCTPRLDRPHWFGQRPYSGRRVEDDLCSVETKRHPIKRVVSTVANVDRNLAKRRLKDRPPCVAFHVVRRFIEVADAWDVVLSVLSNDIAIVAYDNRRVPQRSALNVVM